MFYMQISNLLKINVLTVGYRMLRCSHKRVDVFFYQQLTVVNFFKSVFIVQEIIDVLFLFPSNRKYDFSM